MHLLIHTLLATPVVYFFSEEGIPIKSISLSSSSGFIDDISQQVEFSDVRSIFYVSGPASFTALRNLSVFLQMLHHFSSIPYSFFAIPTHDFLCSCFPSASYLLLSAGKRESFLSTPSSSFSIYPNTRLLEIIPTGDLVGGFYAEEMGYKKAPFYDLFFTNILNNKKKYYTNTITIDYGALPNIGGK